MVVLSYAVNSGNNPAFSHAWSLGYGAPVRGACFWFIGSLAHWLMLPCWQGGRLGYPLPGPRSRANGLVGMCDCVNGVAGVPFLRQPRMGPSIGHPNHPPEWQVGAPSELPKSVPLTRNGMRQLFFVAVAGAPVFRSLLATNYVTEGGRWGLWAQAPFAVAPEPARQSRC